MIVILTVIVLMLAAKVILEKFYSAHFDRKYGPHIVQFYDGTYGVRRRTLLDGFEFLGPWPSDGSAWWYQHHLHPRVYRFGMREEANDCLIAYLAERKRAEELRKQGGGKRV